MQKDNLALLAGVLVIVLGLGLVQFLVTGFRVEPFVVKTFGAMIVWGLVLSGGAYWVYAGVKSGVGAVCLRCLAFAVGSHLALVGFAGMVQLLDPDSFGSLAAAPGQTIITTTRSAWGETETTTTPMSVDQQGLLVLLFFELLCLVSVYAPAIYQAYSHQKSANKST